MAILAAIDMELITGPNKFDLMTSLLIDGDKTVGFTFGNKVVSTDVCFGHRTLATIEAVVESLSARSKDRTTFDLVVKVVKNNSTNEAWKLLAQGRLIQLVEYSSATRKCSVIYLL